MRGSRIQLVVFLAAAVAAAAVAAALVSPTQYLKPGFTLRYDVGDVNLRDGSFRKVGFISFTVVEEKGGRYLLQVKSDVSSANGAKIIVDADGRDQGGDLLGLWLPQGFQVGQTLRIAGVEATTAVKKNYIVAMGRSGETVHMWVYDPKTGLLVMYLHVSAASGEGVGWKLANAGGGQQGPAAPTQPARGGVPILLLLIAFVVLGVGILLYLRGRSSRQQYVYGQYGQPVAPGYPQPGAAAQGYQQGYQQYGYAQPRYCPRCGAPLPPGATVCPRCGARVA